MLRVVSVQENPIFGLGKGTTAGIICLDLNTRLYVAPRADAEIKQREMEF